MALRNGWTTKGVIPCYQPGPLPEILTTANLRHAASRIWNCAEGFVEWSFSLVITTTPPRHILLPTNSESIVYQYFSPMDRVLFRDSRNKDRSTLWSLFYCLYCWVWTGIWLLIDNSLMVMYVCMSDVSQETNAYPKSAINILKKDVSKLCPKLTIKALERLHWLRSGVFNVNF